MAFGMQPSFPGFPSASQPLKSLFAQPPKPAPTAPNPYADPRASADLASLNPHAGQTNPWRGTPPAGAQKPQQQAQPQGTQNGPGLLEQWFDERATGTDPAYEYGMKRGMDSIDSRMAAGGSYNSGARGQQLSDFAANMGAQREGQLDALAGGASGERQRLLETMFGVQSGLAGGQAGTAGAYDTTNAAVQGNALDALLQMMMGKAGVQGKADQAGITNLIKLGSLFA